VAKIRKLLKTYERKEGAVRDIGEKVDSGKITPSQAKKESVERGIIVDNLTFTPTGIFFTLLGLLGFILCIFPTIYKYSNFEALSFVSGYQVFDVHLVVIGIFLIVLIVMSILIFKVTRYRAKAGGCDADDYTVFLMKDGPYSVVRHPTHICALIWVISLLVIVSPVIQFTILSILGIILIIIAFYLMEMQEEKFNQAKFGEEYRYTSIQTS